MEINIQAEIKNAGDSLVNEISKFSDEQLNMIPFEGSWTAGQVVEHLLKSASGVVGAINADAGPTERAADAFVKNIAETFLAFNVKFESPEFVLPSDGPHSSTVLRQEANKIFDDLVAAINTNDLSLTYNEFSLPGSPPMTRLEWAYFGLYHTQRHLRQLANIRKFV